MYLLQPYRAKFSAQSFSPSAGNDANSQLERLSKPASHASQAMRYRNYLRVEKQDRDKKKTQSTRPPLLPLALKEKLKRDAVTKSSEESPLI